MEENSKKPSLAEQYVAEGSHESQTLVDMTESYRAAYLGKRCMAFLIDKSILMFVAFIARSFLPNHSDEALSSVFMKGLSLSFVLDFLYAGYFYSKKQATPGKMAFNIRVMGEDKRSLSFIRGALRDSFGKYLSGLILWLGYLMAFFRKDGKALHDLIFQTRVVSKK